MNDAIALHHRLEAEVYRLRLLRDLKNPEFSAEKEDAVLDAMEEAWLRLSAEDRRVLEAERIVRDAAARASIARVADAPAGAARSPAFRTDPGPAA